MLKIRNIYLFRSWDINTYSCLSWSKKPQQPWCKKEMVEIWQPNKHLFFSLKKLIEFTYLELFSTRNREFSREDDFLVKNSGNCWFFSFRFVSQRLQQWFQFVSSVDFTRFLTILQNRQTGLILAVLAIILAVLMRSHKNWRTVVFWPLRIALTFDHVFFFVLILFTVMTIWNLKTRKIIIILTWNKKVLSHIQEAFVHRTIQDPTNNMKMKKKKKRNISWKNIYLFMVSLSMGLLYKEVHGLSY